MSSLPPLQNLELKNLNELNREKQEKQQHELNGLMWHLQEHENTKKRRSLKRNKKVQDVSSVKSNVLGEESLETRNTSDVIYDQYRHSKNQYKLITPILMAISSIIAVGAIVSISLMTYDEFIAITNDRRAYLGQTDEFCKNSQFGSIDVILTSIGAFFILIFVLVSLFN